MHVVLYNGCKTVVVVIVASERPRLMCSISGKLMQLKLAAMLRWFTAGGAIRIAVRQLLQTWKLHHDDVIDYVITRKV